jgi:hypothetical protein
MGRCLGSCSATSGLTGPLLRCARDSRFLRLGDRDGLLARDCVQAEGLPPRDGCMARYDTARGLRRGPPETRSLWHSWLAVAHRQTTENGLSTAVSTTDSFRMCCRFPGERDTRARDSKSHLRSIGHDPGARSMLIVTANPRSTPATHEVIERRPDLPDLRAFIRQTGAMPIYCRSR